MNANIIVTLAPEQAREAEQPEEPPGEIPVVVFRNPVSRGGSPLFRWRRVRAAARLEPFIFHVVLAFDTRRREKAGGSGITFFGIPVRARFMVGPDVAWRGAQDTVNNVGSVAVPVESD